MLTVDASVWVAAGHSPDTFADNSRAFFSAAAHRRETYFVPAFAEIEIACALARKRQDADAGRKWAKSILAMPSVTAIPIDRALLAFAVHLGTRFLLRAGDALYVAVAAIYSAPLISWDAELIRRAGALTPTDWLAKNAT